MSLLPHQFGYFEYWIFVLIFSTVSAWRTITNIQNSTCPMWQLCAAMMSWLFTNRLCATRWMKVKRMGITEILRRIWLFSANKIPYARHHNPLLIRNRSWILTIHKARILRKKPLEKTFLNFKKWVKSIQTAGYNGARTVVKTICVKIVRAFVVCGFIFR